MITNQEQVKAAAERLRRYYGSNESIESIYGLGESASMSYANDNMIVARNAALAEHPADDDEPITEEWLESSGALDALTEAFGMLHISDGVVRVGKGLSTRGEVRRLCEALGIELNSEGTK